MYLGGSNDAHLCSQFPFVRAGTLGLSRFSSLAENMDRQSSAPAASVASLESPCPSRTTSFGQFEVMTKGTGGDQ